MAARVVNPVSEVGRFLRAALLDPVEHAETRDADPRRRRIVSVITLVVGAAVLGWSLRLPAGDSLFYVGTLLLALVWTAGAFASGPLHLGRGHTRVGGASRPVVQSLALGVLLLALFLAGALIVARIPFLREPVDELLDHARFGSLPVVAAITAVNGLAEELYFRGSLFAALPRAQAVAGTTLVYALVTSAAGIPLLTLAAVLLGVVVGLQRRVTGGILGPVITHLTWSLGMLFTLPWLLRVLA